VISARGGTRYYDLANHQWPDTVMAVLEYGEGKGVVTAAYQMLASSGHGGRYEAFLGDQGSLELSESPSRSTVYRDPETPDWDRWVQLGLLKDESAAEAKPVAEGVVQARPTRLPVRYSLPMQIGESHAVPHLTNFLDAVEGGGELACGADEAYATLATVLKMGEAMESGCAVRLSEADYRI